MPELLGDAIKRWAEPYEPWCATHAAPMTHDKATYVCKGFDGEGCPATVTFKDIWGWMFPPPEEFARMVAQWQPIYPPR